MFANIVWTPKLANIPHSYVFLIQMIDGNCMFSNSLAKLANMVRDKKVGKPTPSNLGGLLCRAPQNIIQILASVKKYAGLDVDFLVSSTDFKRIPNSV